jgi:hypothetical protein
MSGFIAVTRREIVIERGSNGTIQTIWLCGYDKLDRCVAQMSITDEEFEQYKKEGITVKE